MTTGMAGIEGVAERVSRGGDVTATDAQLLLDTPDLITVGAIADDVRRRMHGTRTSFVRVFEVHVDAPPAMLPPRTAAGEIRIVGTPGSLDAAVAAVEQARALAGSRPVNGFSLAELQSLGEGTLQEVCARLREAGLDGVDAVPVDLLADPAAAVNAARAGGLSVLRITVHGGAAAQRIAVLTRARDLQQAVGGFRAFAPLPGAISVAAPTTGYDDVKLVAAARLLAANVPSIQVDWAHYGPKLAQVALTMGADDVDGVAAADPGLLGTRRSPLEEIRGNISAAGLTPVERDGRFEPLPD